MNKIIDATQKQILRGQVLSLCNELNTTGAGVTLMHMVFKKRGLSYSQENIIEACYYLQDKGWITFKHIQSDALDIERDIAFITAVGIDILETTKPIEGIIIG